MFSLSFVALGVTALAFATPTRRAPKLEVALSAPTSVTTISDIKVTASVTNTGSEPVTVIKYGTILDSDLPTASFEVTKGDQVAEFIGLKIIIDSSSMTETGYVTIPAGETVTVTHDVASLYDFETLGVGKFSFTPITTFQVIGEDPKPNSFNIAASSFDVHVEGDVSKRDLLPTPTAEEVGIHKRATVSCSNASQSSFIAASYTEAKTLASVASAYVSTNGANSLYTSYFGSTSTSTVISKFTAVKNEATSSRTLNCSDPYGVCDGNVIAYTLISGVNPIYYCSIFYNEKATSTLCSGTTVASRNVRGGTTLHELTHAVASTTDVGYGCSYDQSLASSSPSQAASNADNYNCFSTQVYQNTQC